MFEKGRTLEMKRISAVFRDNRQILKKKYADPKFQPFRLRTIERPTNIEQLRAKVLLRLLYFILDFSYRELEVFL
jgi:hypothetical protein